MRGSSPAAVSGLNLLSRFQEAIMNDSVQITIDRDVYQRLQLLMVPPLSDANAVIKSLLLQDGHASPAAIEVEASTRHFSFAQELERAQAGVYECGGAT